MRLIVRGKFRTLQHFSFSYFERNMQVTLHNHNEFKAAIALCKKYRADAHIVGYLNMASLRQFKSNMICDYLGA